MLCNLLHVDNRLPIRIRSDILNIETGAAGKQDLALFVMSDTSHVPVGFAGDKLHNGQFAVHRVSVSDRRGGCICRASHHGLFLVRRQKCIQRLLPLSAPPRRRLARR